mmetsp:Transcript_837/g.2185  ORF Transcript_837/g.2185 Transcript_837/m.2185 type:complete len:208 (-) Transcript_837:73-696(-)
MRTEQMIRTHKRASAQHFKTTERPLRETCSRRRSCSATIAGEAASVSLEHTHWLVFRWAHCPRNLAQDLNCRVGNEVRCLLGWCVNARQSIRCPAEGSAWWCRLLSPALQVGAATGALHGQRVCRNAKAQLEFGGLGESGASRDVRSAVAAQLVHARAVVKGGGVGARRGGLPAAAAVEINGACHLALHSRLAVQRYAHGLRVHDGG